MAEMNNLKTCADVNLEEKRSDTELRFSNSVSQDDSHINSVEFITVEKELELFDEFDQEKLEPAEIKAPVKKRGIIPRTVKTDTVRPFSSKSSEEESNYSEQDRPKKKRRLKNRRTPTEKKKPERAVNELPSVYSSFDIKNHERRLKRLKALEENSEEENEESEDDNVDPDLDINLRIFESSVPSIENVIIGEIQCNVRENATNPDDIVEKGNKNINIFKLSVNANFDKERAENEENRKNREKRNVATVHNIVMDLQDAVNGSDDDIDKEIDAIFSHDLGEFSDENESDLDILVSKPLFRKRVPPAVKKKKLVVSTDKKLTMYDLVCDSMASRNNEGRGENKDGRRKSIDKNIESKTKEVEEKEVTFNKDSTSSNPAVPQLKVTADGEVVLDMDSLIIEQTGLSDAREAIANSEAIEEYAFSNKSYSKKRNIARQWSPQETFRFYHVLSTIGTDFSLMATLFPGRTRTCMKRKFKREEKSNTELIMKALSCRQNFDLKLLEKELRLKDARVDELRNKSKQKIKEAKKTEKLPVETKKKTGSKKRQSFFEKGIQSFQNV